MILIWKTAILISLVVWVGSSNVPSAVEIPPMQTPQRDQGRKVQYSYSYGTTAYRAQPAVQSSGFASSSANVHHDTRRASALSQSSAAIHVPAPSVAYPPATPQRPECQNPMLRVFFKTCHAPGAAPPSPIQCTPIPGDTRFRCTIKQGSSWPVARVVQGSGQSFPVARVIQCVPGTVYSSSSSECIPSPVGSFSTGPVVIPVVTAAPGRPQSVHPASTVYRHCASGQCQTCIGEQCSTTAVLTPVSVDHRGWVNSSTEVVAFGDAGRDVKQKCIGTVCKTCIDRICYDRSYPLLRVTAGCPPAVCENNCTGFVYWNDNCPICQCRGFACREPCRTQNDCPSVSTCGNQVCVYAELPSNVRFDKVCTFASQCPASELCYNWRCGAKPAKSRHLEDHSCAVDQDCPTGYICADMSCWEGDHNRLKGQACLLDHQCPAGYFCMNGACTDGYHHGSFDSFSPGSPTIPPTTVRQCDHDRQCYGGETCWEHRCVSYQERRQMEEDRQRQQSQHDPWTAQPITPSTAPPTPDPQEEYQRRLAEYNRQKMEEETRQRRVDEERRRGEEENRRKEQEELARKREEEENTRRRQAEEELRRRQEQQQGEEQQRRRAEEEARTRREQEEQQRLRGEEEARRQREQELEQQRERETAEESRRRQQQEEENARRREQAEREAQRGREEEERRRQEEAEIEASGRRQGAAGSIRPVATPDIEIGEEMPGDYTAPEYDPGEEYARRMEEYNRQVRERQEHDQGEDDFYSQTRHTSSPAETEEEDDGGISVSYRVNDQNQQRRQ